MGCHCSVVVLLVVYFAHLFAFHASACPRLEKTSAIQARAFHPQRLDRSYLSDHTSGLLIGKYELSTRIFTIRRGLPHLRSGIDCPVLLWMHVKQSARFLLNGLKQ